ncbi:RcnB family protein [Parasphingopyxis sp. CP4]|nr:RcnB family protein [Parasphingopyxis sp. CP4]
MINWAHYGLGQPGYGHRWVRHYNDAYLVDQYGRVSDSRYDVGYEGDRYYDDRYNDDRRDYRDDDDRRGGNAGDTVAGAIAGGVIGGVAGNLIAGAGDRTEGTIIGAAVGAIAGGAIGNAAGRNDRRGGYDDRYYNDRVPEYVGDGDFYPPAAPGYGQQGNPYLGYQPASTVQTTVTVNGVTTHASQTVGGITQSSTTTVVTSGCCRPRTTVVTTPQTHHARHQGHAHTSGHHAEHRPHHATSRRDAHPHTAQHHAQHPHQHGPTPVAYAPDQPLPGPAPQLDVPNPPERTINFIEEEVR